MFYRIGLLTFTLFIQSGFKYRHKLLKVTQSWLNTVA